MGIKLADGVLPNTTLDINGAASFREGAALVLANGVNSNVALTDFSLIRITGPTAAFSVTGFANGTDGRVLTLINATTQMMTLTHQATSTAANQINTGGTSLTLPGNAVVTMIYNTSLARWFVTGSIGGTVALNNITNGSTGDSLLVINNGVPGRVRPVDYIETYAWGLDGNLGTTAGTHFVGTMDVQDLVFKSNGIEGMRLKPTGRLGINTTAPQYKLDIDAQTASAGNPLRLLGLNAGVTSDSIISSSGGVLRRLSVNQVIANAWNITGNAGTVDGTNYIGTSDNIPLSIRVNNVRSGYIGLLASGNTFLGYQAGLVNTGTFSTFIGVLAGSANTTGTENTAVGHTALQSNTTGEDNTAVGQEALKSNTTGISNTGLGESSLQYNTTGSNNTGVGAEALFRNTIGSYNAAIGRNTLYNTTTASRNIAIGHEAMYVQSFNNGGSTWDSDNIGIGYQSLYSNQPTSTSTGYRNIGIGTQSLNANTTGANNLGIGYQAGFSNTTGYINQFIGDGAGYSNTTGWRNMAIGYQAGYHMTTGQGNILLGRFAGFSNTTDKLTGDKNVVIGDEAGKALTSGNQNVFIGDDAGFNTTSGLLNVAVGQGALYTNTGGTYNTALGHGAGYSNTASSNTWVGRNAGYWATTGTNNTLVGEQAGVNASTGSQNTFIGTGAGFGANPTSTLAIGTGSDNVFMGYWAGYNFTTASKNIAIGREAMMNVSTGANNTVMGYQASSANTTGSNNTTIGYQSGAANSTGGNNTFVGYQSDAVGSALTNATAIGYNAKVAASSSLVLGGTGTDAVSVGIGTATPLALLHLSSNNGGLANDVLVTAFNATDVSAIGLRRARGTEAAPSNVATGDQLGGLHFYGYVSGAFTNLSRINATYKGSGTTNLSTLDFMTNGVTQMTIDENGNMGVNTAGTNNAKMDVNGSVAAAITGTTASLTLSSAHYTVIIQNSAHVITLPAASTCLRRIYILVNQSTISTLGSSGFYKNFSNVNTTTIPANSSITIQSDGVNWYRIQ